MSTQDSGTDITSPTRFLYPQTIKIFNRSGRELTQGWGWADS